MSPAPQQPAIPAVTPHLIIAGVADAIEFYKNAFGAEEMIRMPGDDGKMVHASISINGHMVMMVDERPEQGMRSPKALGGTPVSLHLNVENVDASIKRARDAGATVTMEPADMFWGDRFAAIEDPFGHQWTMGHPIKQMSEEELKEAARTAMSQS